MNNNFLNVVLSAKNNEERKTKLSGALDRIKEKKAKEKEAEEQKKKDELTSWRENIIEKAKEIDYAKDVFKNQKYTVGDFSVEDTSDKFMSAYLPISGESKDIGIDVFLDVTQDKGLQVALNPYDFEAFDLEFPFADDSVLFEGIFGFPVEELYQADDYDKVLKTLDKLTNRAVVDALGKRIDQFLEDNYDKIEKIIGE